MEFVNKSKRSVLAVVLSLLFVISCSSAQALGVWVNSASLPYNTPQYTTANFGGSMGFDSEFAGAPIPSLCFIQIECPPIFGVPYYTSGSFSSMSFWTGTGVAGNSQRIGRGSNWISGQGTLSAYANAYAGGYGSGTGYVGTGPESFQRDYFGTMNIV